MSVIKNVDEKVADIIVTFPSGFTDEEFLIAFKGKYPQDYQKCMNRFLEEERKTKPGKPHPMQHPDKHIVSALHSYKSRKLK